MTMMLDYTSAELLIIIVTVVLLLLLLAEMCDWSRLVFTCDHSFTNNYTYNDSSALMALGPVSWKDRFPQSNGDQQSPINISSNCAVVILAETLPPLTFSVEYHTPPKDLRVYNDGHCVTLYARWPNDVRPTLMGGPLTETYQFVSARFRWGPNDDEGSEHTIDSHRYAMELQVTHIKADEKYLDIQRATEDNAVVVLSYFFEVNSVGNPYLKPLINALKKVQCPFRCTNIEPAPLALLMPPFVSKYYMYSGSLTFPPCTEGVQWIIQPEPMAISPKQVRKFRKLCAIDGPIDINTRPVQVVNGRDIFYYD